MTTDIGITQSMLDAAGECIERATVHSDMEGVAFLQVEGGRIAIYHLEYKQALRRRFDNIVHARGWAINKIMSPKEAGR